MNRSKRKACKGKFRWPSIEAAQSYCFHKRQARISIQAYHCRYCGGIHVGHFQQDELPRLETTMSKTRVYQIWPAAHGYPMSGIFVERADAEEALARFHTAVLCEKDMDDEDAYAQLCTNEMQEQETWARTRRARERELPAIRAALTQERQRWTDCATRPEPPKLRRYRCAHPPRRDGVR